ncbi:Transcription elongation factor SPT5 [Seminavis robusta]|uniref:Transcription elongation factor SPT5 n=1 Tax=Seminavis robusta TaxID=568900 RepID=A0A9N8HC73_9STRA|nr:Transcription elongation factor SPT5 [Seminavis robusta]|eukprot:Sro394_g133920.1 Transcription elongation factor SPT5 (355) ;mRNA; f:57891-58955
MSTVSFFRGDSIKVIGGDLMGLNGEVLSQDDKHSVTIRVQIEGEQHQVTVLSSQVQKHIPVYAHVKVFEGRYTDETGTVVAIPEDDMAVVVTDQHHKEITVRISQLCQSTDTSSGEQDSLQGYHLYDLVATNQEVGIVVRVGANDLSFMNQHGTARKVRPQELRGKRNLRSQRTTYFDRRGATMRQGSMVAVAAGPQRKGQSGTIRRLYKSHVFLFSPTQVENSGIFVVPSRSCALVGSSNTSIQSAKGWPRYRQKWGQPQGLVGKTVRIRSGQWKGYQGTVSQTTANHVLVQLDSRPKKVRLLREKVHVVMVAAPSGSVNTRSHPDDLISGMVVGDVPPGFLHERTVSSYRYR